MPVTTRRSGLLAVFVTSFLLLLLFSQWVSHRQFSNAIQVQLQQQLPGHLAGAGPGWDGQAFSWRGLAQRIDRDLAHLAPLPRWGALASCSARVLTLEGETFGVPQAGDRVLPVTLEQGRPPVELALLCRSNWLYAVPLQGLLAGLFTWLLAMLPQPLSEQQRAYVARFVQLGATRREACRLASQLDACSPGQLQVLDRLLALPEPPGLAAALRWASDARAIGLDEDRLRWFSLALVLSEGDAEQALAVAAAEPLLVFIPSASMVRIHGVEVRLAGTPFFYYLWYARQRLQDPDPDGGGWFINPPSNRADHGHGAELVALMELHQGHSKAINELREKGLRAKILDQNRSKVKEQVTAVLGDELAAAYLFELERDPRTARFRCRIVTAPGNIRVQSTARSP